MSEPIEGEYSRAFDGQMPCHESDLSPELKTAINELISGEQYEIYISDIDGIV